MYWWLLRSNWCKISKNILQAGSMSNEFVGNLFSVSMHVDQWALKRWWGACAKLAKSKLPKYLGVLQPPQPTPCLRPCYSKKWNNSTGSNILVYTARHVSLRIRLCTTQKRNPRPRLDILPRVRDLYFWPGIRIDGYKCYIRIFGFRLRDIVKAWFFIPLQPLQCIYMCVKADIFVLCELWIS